VESYGKEGQLNVSEPPWRIFARSCSVEEERSGMNERMNGHLDRTKKAGGRTKR
jgi:hypothetical protein